MLPLVQNDRWWLCYWMEVLGSSIRQGGFRAAALTPRSIGVELVTQSAVNSQISTWPEKTWLTSGYGVSLVMLGLPVHPELVPLAICLKGETPKWFFGFDK